MGPVTWLTGEQFRENRCWIIASKTLGIHVLIADALQPLHPHASNLQRDAAGPVPQTAESLREQLVAEAVPLSPGLTTDLPGSLIEDIVSTDVGALLVCDQARVDLINSVGPLKTNLTMLNLLAQQSGIALQQT